MALRLEHYQSTGNEPRIVLPSRELSPKDQSFYSYHAELLGNKVSPERLHNVAERSNAERFQFHGVKNFGYIDNVVALGIQPRTPEGGHASYWASGHALFGEYPSVAPLSTLNSPLHNWGHSRAKDGMGHMTLAVVKDQPEFKPNGEITIHRDVSPYELMLLRVDMHRRDINSGLTPTQEIEWRMFELLEQVVVHGRFKPGVELARNNNI